MVNVLKNKNAAFIVMFSIWILFFVVVSFGIYKIYLKLNDVILQDIKNDFYAVSVVSFYTENLNTISWINKQLKRAFYFNMACTFVPMLLEFLPVVKMSLKLINMYANYIVRTLNLRAKFLATKLRLKNGLSLFSLDFLKNAVVLKRGKGLDLYYFYLPSYIEVKGSVFKTACIKSKSLFSRTSFCVDTREDVDRKSPWFIPFEQKWFVRYKRNVHARSSLSIF